MGKPTQPAAAHSALTRYSLCFQSKRFLIGQPAFALVALLVLLTPAVLLRAGDVPQELPVAETESIVATNELGGNEHDVNTSEADDGTAVKGAANLSSRFTGRTTEVEEPLPDKPLHTTTSYYMNTIDPNQLGTLGQAAGEKTVSLSGSSNDLIILVFGAPKSRNGIEGSYIFNPSNAPSSGFASTSEIEQAAQAFVKGYLARAKPKARLNLVLGTSNYGAQVTSQHGMAWARMVNNVAIWAAETGLGGRVAISGGNDIEADWNEAKVTRAWVDGYLSVGGAKLYNFGDAAGCPWNDKGALTCNNEWTVNDIWYVSSGAGNVQPIPQIYNPTMAKQWYQLRKYSLTKVRDGFKPMEIAGLLTMDGDCKQEGGCGAGFDLKPEEAYRELSGLLNGTPETAQNLPWASDIKKAWLP